jgi:uncharacterized SAM-dependent methyltransferase
MNNNSLNLRDTEVYGSQTNEKEFVQAILGLLTETLSGHMERWEYAPPEYVGDPAAGSLFWAEFIRTTNSYYLLNGEELLIKEAINSSTLNILGKLRTVIELGPGSKEALNKKTVPFLSACKDLRSYIAVDSEISQAEFAIKHIHDKYNILNTHVIEQSFESLSLNVPRLGPTGIIMWGCTLGNIPGHSGRNPYDHLLQSLKGLRDSINSGDHIFISFDTEEHKQPILNAYNHPLLSACFLSPLHRLVRNNLVEGNFDPYKWKHKSVWIPESMQCAHTIYPTEDQDFEVCGTKIFIPKNKKLITNNSYKFSEETILTAARNAGLVPKIYKHTPMALLIAHKP